MRFRDTLWVIVACMSCQSTGPKHLKPAPVMQSDPALSLREPSGTDTPSPAPLVIEAIPIQDAKNLPAETRPALHLVLMPAKANGFSYIGAMESLRQKGIQIKSITASGFPGLLATLFAFSKSPNQLEWQLTKLPAESWATKSWYSSQARVQIPQSWQKHLTQTLKDKHPLDAPIPVHLPLTNGMDAGVCDAARNLSLFTGEPSRPPCPELSWQEVQMELQGDALIRYAQALARGENILVLQTEGKPRFSTSPVWTLSLGFEEEDSWDVSRLQSRMRLQYRGRTSVQSNLKGLEALLMEKP